MQPATRPNLVRPLVIYGLLLLALYLASLRPHAVTVAWNPAQCRCAP